MNAPDVSVVIPLYDEEESVERLCAAVREALAGWDHDWELVLVDDGSKDRTLERLLEQARGDERVRVVPLRRNSGQTLAMATGFAQARGRIIVSMDGDLQNDPRDIPLVVSRLGAGYDVVCGWRRERQDRWLSRTLPSKIANFLIARITGIPIHDNGCSLKAYRAEVIRALNLYSEMHRFLPALSSMTGARIAEVVVRHHPRMHGQSKYGIGRTFRVLADIVTIKMITRFATRPGLWFGVLALPWLALGVLSGGAWIVDLVAEAEPGTVSIVLPSLSMVFFYLFGSMLSLSVISEMYLANADRRYMRQLAEVLTVSSAPQEILSWSGPAGGADGPRARG